MVTIQYAGRLGNNLFQYSAAHIFANKFNLTLNTNPPENNFGLSKLNGLINDGKTIIVDDDNFMELLSSDKIDSAHYHFTGYFQLKDFILGYHEEIKKLFNLKYRDGLIDEVFVIYRIGDINGERQMLPIEYYEESLNNIKFNHGYISSDTPDHPNIKKLISKFNLTLYNDTPINTIDFAKNFNKLVLSEGSFSWWIGFLSNAKKIYFNKRERFWHGDIFVLPDWDHLSYDWDKSCVGDKNKLNCNKIIKL